ncbi:hypothetical protein C1903_00690 [Listeria ivanovii]|uniref:hypothetical protein n=1 Tax=Listeria ivanovii TaxID=1638 RepID=UPI000DAA301D|nr:hypothetical protein [Listeria ivanovii]PZF91403.1 hypothetical protein C1905_00680 [Listeria ivanovii]PZF96911.1 hypothetical protein C1903_00690 [Listeria ivanovii]PZG06842.1 hypothetical protein C2L88_00170 [Listeria ivanovii]PZG11917.1 hypothetical protein C1901_00685 [Listeria ivanovii]PZG29042.1 hypothetical protein C1900_00680 [Listeria ivanovii]
MKQEAYNAVKMKVDQEKKAILKELQLLLAKRKQVAEKLAHEKEVYYSRTKKERLQVAVLAGSMQLDAFSPTRITQMEREITQIGQYIQSNEQILEQLQEKGKQAKKMYDDTRKKWQQLENKKEEQTLRDLKMVLLK